MKIVIGGTVVVGCGGGEGGPGSSSSGLDVAVHGLDVPSEAQAGATIDVAVTVENRGSIPASPAVSFHLAAHSDVGLTDQLLTLSLPRLIFDPGESIRVEERVTVPDNLASGTFYVGAIAPPGDGEQTPENNFSSGSVAVSGTDCTPDDFESDDVPDEAQSIELVAPQRHNFCDDDTDWVEFDAPAAATYTLLAFDQEEKAAVLFGLLDQEGALVPATSVGNDLWTWQAPAAGKYRLVAAAQGGLLGTGAQTGYSFVLGDDRPDIAFLDMLRNDFEETVGDVLYADPSFELRGLRDPGSVRVGLYLSEDGTVTTSDRLLRSIVLPTSEIGSTSIAAGVPQDLAPGSYYLGAIADPNDELAELVETNNASPPATLSVVARDGCTPDMYEPDDIEDQAGELVLRESQVHDLCDDTHDWFAFDAVGGTEYRVRFDHMVNFQVELELFDSAGSNLVPPQPGSLSWTAPDSGRYLVQVISQHDSTYDPRGLDDEYTIELLPPTADLVPTKVDAFSGLYSGGQSPVDVEVTNTGGATASGFILAAYLSTDSTVTTADTLIDESPLTSVDWQGAGRTAGWQLTVTVPDTITPGSYYLGLIVDPTDVVTELDETNNVLVVPVTVQ